MKTLTLVTIGKNLASREELLALEAEDRIPRASLFGTALNTDLLDERYLAGLTGTRAWLYHKLPGMIAQLTEAFRVRRKYDAVISWTEQLGLLFALLLKVTGSRTPHVGIWSWISPPRKAALLKRVHTHVDRIILMSSVQRNFALHELKIPESRIVLLRWPVDQKFWRPMDQPTDMICAVGREMRDYGTLINAIRDVHIPCHIAANYFPGKKDAWIKTIEQARPIPEHITIGKKDFLELRALYARSRFVVIPLLPTDTDNGTTAILEAMAMGKAVICSSVEGQKDVIENGRTGILVPPGDARALQEAIVHLRDNPDVACRLGKNGRKHVEQYHSLDSWVLNVQHVLREVIEGSLDRQGHTHLPSNAVPQQNVEGNHVP